MRIGRVTDHTGAINRGAFGNQEVGAGDNPVARKRKYKAKRKQESCFFHID